MSTTADQTPTKSSTEFSTKVTGYDYFSSMLTALVLLVGFFAVLLFLLWLTKVVVPKLKIPNVIAINELRGRGAAAKGVARDIEEPGVEELPDVQEPQLADALEAMTDAISSTKGVRESFEGNAAEMGTGTGQGDSRGEGPGGEGTLDGIPDWDRWEIRYSTTSAQDYATKLDFFNIELGAINRKTPNIEYARGLRGAPQKRSGTRDQDKRLYFIQPPNGALVALTTELLAKAGIVTDDRYLAQFYSDEAYALLLAAEQASLGGKSLAKVRKTIFGIRSAGGGFEFYVIRQDFLPGA